MSFLKDLFGTALKIGAPIAGGVFGGPLGALAGGAAGKALSNTLDGGNLGDLIKGGALGAAQGGLGAIGTPIGASGEVSGAASAALGSSPESLSSSVLAGAGVADAADKSFSKSFSDSLSRLGLSGNQITPREGISLGTDFLGQLRARNSADDETREAAPRILSEQNSLLNFLRQNPRRRHF